MNAIRSIGLVALTIIAMPVRATAHLDTVPRAFRGEWHRTPRACGTFDADSIRIAARRLETFESVGDVTAVERIDARSVTLRMRMTHGGGTFGNESRLQLVDNPRLLLVGDELDPDIYMRCAR